MKYSILSRHWSYTMANGEAYTAQLLEDKEQITEPFSNNDPLTSSAIEKIAKEIGAFNKEQLEAATKRALSGTDVTTDTVIQKLLINVEP